MLQLDRILAEILRTQTEAGGTAGSAGKNAKAATSKLNKAAASTATGAEDGSNGEAKSGAYAGSSSAGAGGAVSGNVKGNKAGKDKKKGKSKVPAGPHSNEKLAGQCKLVLPMFRDGSKYVERLCICVYMCVYLYVYTHGRDHVTIISLRQTHCLSPLPSHSSSFLSIHPQVARFTHRQSVLLCPYLNIRNVVI